MVEEERWTAGGDHATMNLRDFQMGINSRLHRDEVFVTAEPLDEGAQIRE